MKQKNKAAKEVILERLSVGVRATYIGWGNFPDGRHGIPLRLSPTQERVVREIMRIIHRRIKARYKETMRLRLSRDAAGPKEAAHNFWTLRKAEDIERKRERSE
jgi:hypothetical protein